MQNKAFKEMKELRAKALGSLPETEDKPLSSDIGPVERVLFELWESPEPKTSAAETPPLSAEGSDSE